MTAYTHPYEHTIFVQVKPDNRKLRKFSKNCILVKLIICRDVDIFFNVWGTQRTKTQAIVLKPLPCCGIVCKLKMYDLQEEYHFQEKHIKLKKDKRF